jgi:uncharacterized protein DUF3618
MGQAANEVSDPQDVDRMTTDPDVERLTEDIEQTRDQMTDTVEEIGDRLDPRNIVAGAKETIREATVGKVEEMATTASEIASDATDTVRDAGTGLIDTITRNPLPAAMVGIGLGWLVMSSRNQGQARQVDWNARRMYATRYDSPRYGSAEHDASRPDPMRQARERADAVASDVGDAVDRVATRAGELAEDVPYQVRSTAVRLGDTAADVFEGSPLAVGAIALAVGAAVGLALPPTSMERRTLAEPARQAMRKVETAATDALGQVEDQARDIEQQAHEEDRQARPH